MALFLPAPLHRAALKLAHPLRVALWQVTRREVHGCNAIVCNPEGEVLLVRHSYLHPDRWMLPGGGIGRGESIEDSAVREVREETGCRMSDARGFGSDVVAIGRCRNHVHLVAGATGDVPRCDGRELLDARFFPLDALPAATAGATRARIERWRDAQRAAGAA